MSGANFNITDRFPLLKQPANIVDVFSVADLPSVITAPDGVSRCPLALNTRYHIHKSFVWPRCLFPVATNPNLIANSTDIVGVAGFAPEIQIDGDDTTHFWGREMALVQFRDTNIVDVGNAGMGRSSRLFDFVGGSGNSFSFLLINFVTIRNFKRIGNTVDMGLQISATFWSNNEGGLIARVNTSATVSHTYFLSNMYFIQDGNATIKPQIVFQGGVPSSIFSNNNLNQNVGDASIMVDNVFSGELDMVGNSYGGVIKGDFFRPNVSQSISSMVNQDISISGFANSSINPGVDTSVSVAPGHGLKRGQVILIKDAGIGTFDGTHTILRVAADEASFDIAVVFDVTTTGNVKITRVSTGIANPIVDNETITISGTTSYNGIFRTLFEKDNFSFDIPVAFVFDDATGTVVSTGQNSKTVGVNSRANGAQADSNIIAEGAANGNSTLTTISDGAYTAITLTSFIADVSTERFTLITAVNGVWIYDDPKPFSGRLVAAISGIKSGTTSNYRFTVSINGATPVFASAMYTPMEVKTAKVQVVLAFPVSLIQNDTVQIMVAGDGTAEDIIITDISMSIR